MLQDLRSALRWIARRRGLAMISIGTLGLALGANVAVFSLIDAFLFRPFPVSEPERLAVVMSRTAEGELRHVSAPDYFDFVESGSDRFPLTARMQPSFGVRVGEVTERLAVELVSTNYFDLFGVRLAVGRGFSRTCAVRSSLRGVVRQPPARSHRPFPHRARREPDRR